MPRLVTIDRFTTREEAGLAQMVLDGAGIPSFFEGHTLVGNFWEYANATGGIKLQVTDEHEAAAREILAQGRSPSRKQLATTTVSKCPHCAAPAEPGFDVCWSCGRELAAEVRPETAHEAKVDLSASDDSATEIGDAIVDRAFRAMAFGLASLCPAPVASIYSTALLIVVMAKGYPLSPRGQRRSYWTMAVNCLVLIVFSLFLFLIFAPRR